MKTPSNEQRHRPDLESQVGLGSHRIYKIPRPLSTFTLPASTPFIRCRWVEIRRGRRGEHHGDKLHALTDEVHREYDGKVGRKCRNEAMRVILEVLQGPRKGRSLSSTATIHSSWAVAVRPLFDARGHGPSRDHFMVEINPPLCELRDLGSTNGTFVNNQQVDRVRLVSGDLIAAGQSVFRVRVDLTPLSSSERARPRLRVAIRGRWSDSHKVHRLRKPAPQDITIAGPLQGDATRWSNGGARFAAPNWRPCPSRFRITRHCVRSVAARWASSTSAAQPDRADGRPQADHARDGDHPHGHRSLLPRDVGDQPVAASQHRRMV